MRTLGRLVAWTCAVAAFAVILGAWGRGRPDLTEDDALEFTRQAIASLGFERVAVDGVAVEGAQSTDRGDQLAVWRTRTVVETGTIELAIQRDAGQAVFVTDTHRNGEPGLLTDEQFGELGSFRTDPAVDRRLRDNVSISAGGVATGLAAVFLATHLPPKRGPA